MSLSNKEEILLNTVKARPFVLAPMAGITDCAFRTFMRQLGTPVVVTELLSANGLLYEAGRERTLALAAFEEVQRPIGAQLFGDDPESLAKGALRLQNLGVDFIDLNMGCPVKKVVSKGAGSALLKDLPTLARTLQAVKATISIPLTIKIRTGWTERDRNAHEVVRIAKEEGVLWVAIHGRTRSAGYSGLADWDYIAEVAASTTLPIIGNGDVTSPELAVTRLKNSGCAAVMIGRGCLKNPWIFLEAQSLLKGEPLSHERDFGSLFQKLHDLYREHAGERMALIQLKKFAAWYSSGLPQSSVLRKEIFQLKTIEQVMDRTLSYFLEYKFHKPADTSHEPFLMGGHG